MQLTSDRLAHTSASRSYLIRLWQAGVDSPWRVWVQSVQTGDVLHFADLDAMHAFLQKQIATSQSPNNSIPNSSEIQSNTAQAKEHHS